MERSPIKDVKIKVLLKGALSDKINSREVYVNGIYQSYCYEGFTAFNTENLQNSKVPNWHFGKSIRNIKRQVWNFKFDLMKKRYWL